MDPDTAAKALAAGQISQSTHDALIAKQLGGMQANSPPAPAPAAPTPAPQPTINNQVSGPTGVLPTINGFGPGTGQGPTGVLPTITDAQRQAAMGFGPGTGQGPTGILPTISNQASGLIMPIENNIYTPPNNTVQGGMGQGNSGPIGLPMMGVAGGNQSNTGGAPQTPNVFFGTAPKPQSAPTGIGTTAPGSNPSGQTPNPYMTTAAAQPMPNYSNASNAPITPRQAKVTGQTNNGGF